MAAVERAAADRAAYLDGVCGADVELRQRVDALLAAHAAPGSLLAAGSPVTGDAQATSHVPPDDVPTSGPLPATEAAGAIAPGTVIAGRFTLVEKIGEGGMGEVWVAKQFEPVKRKVALKLIKPGMDSRAVPARFEAERQALALMDHPNMEDREDVLDVVSTEKRVVRGGSANDKTQLQRSAARYDTVPTFYFFNTGMRPARTLPPVP